MNRLVILNSIAFTRYPLTTDNGNVIPWWSLNELMTVLNNPETTLVSLCSYFVDVMRTKLFTTSVGFRHTSTAHDICVNTNMPCYVFLPMGLRDHEKIKKFILLNEVSTVLRFFFVNQNKNEWVENNIILDRCQFNDIPVTHQSNRDGVIKPFCNNPGETISFNIKTTTELPLQRYVPEDFYESSGHWDFNPYLYYDNNQHTNIYRVSDGLYSDWVLAPCVNSIMSNPEFIGSKDLTITLMSWESVLDIPSKELTNAIIKGDVFPIDIIRRGYRFIRLQNGRIYGITDNRLVNISQIKHI